MAMQTLRLKPVDAVAVGWQLLLISDYGCGTVESICWLGHVMQEVDTVVCLN